MHPKIKKLLVEFFLTAGYTQIAKDIKRNYRPLESALYGLELFKQALPESKREEGLQKVKQLEVLLKLY